jgi:hypothetical protein
MVGHAYGIQMLLLILLCAHASAEESRFLASVHEHFGANDEWLQPSEAETDEKAMTNETGREHEKYEGKMERVQKEKKKKKKKIAKYPVIDACHERLMSVFAKSSDLFYMDWKLWVGLALWTTVWILWLKNGYDETNEVYYHRCLSVFGINILILHILEYSSTIKSGMLLVCLLLGAQNLFQNYLSFQYKNQDYDTPRSEVFDCDTLYLDISLPFEQILILFVAQVGVWWFYMTSILGNFNFEHVNYLYWVWAYLTMQITMIFNRGEDSVLGNAFPVHEVYRLALKADSIAFSPPDSEDDKGARFMITKANLILRGLMGFLCNSILREIMSYTIPLMLMGFSEPMDFVVYCVGVNFICTLDDMSEKKFGVFPRTPSREASETGY